MIRVCSSRSCSFKTHFPLGINQSFLILIQQHIPGQLFKPVRGALSRVEGDTGSYLAQGPPACFWIWKYTFSPYPTLLSVLPLRSDAWLNWMCPIIIYFLPFFFSSGEHKLFIQLCFYSAAMYSWPLWNYSYSGSSINGNGNHWIVCMPLWACIGIHEGLGPHQIHTKAECKVAGGEWVMVDWPWRNGSLLGLPLFNLAVTVMDTQTHTHTPKHEHTQARTQTNMHTNTHTHTQTDTHTHRHIQTHMQTHTLTQRLLKERVSTLSCKVQLVMASHFNLGIL